MMEAENDKTNNRYRSRLPVPSFSSSLLFGRLYLSHSAAIFSSKPPCHNNVRTFLDGSGSEATQRPSSCYSTHHHIIISCTPISVTWSFATYPMLEMSIKPDAPSSLGQNWFLNPFMHHQNWMISVRKVGEKNVNALRRQSTLIECRSCFGVHLTRFVERWRRSIYRWGTMCHY